MRANNTERIGVYAVGYIFSSEIDWIFREQKEVDVGIDALIEESVNSNPTGKFLAAQIKTGLGNFYVTKDTLTYYISHIHYQYWLNLSIPIILIAHLPSSKETLWEYITEVNIKPTDKKWKIEIPKSKHLNKNSKTQLEEIINGDYDQKYFQEISKGELSELELEKLTSTINSFQESESSLLKMAAILKNLGSETHKSTDQINEFVFLGYSDQDKKVKSLVKRYSQKLNLYAKQLDNEIKIFAEYFSEGIRSYEKLAYIYLSIYKDYMELRKTNEVMTEMENAIDGVLEGLIIMRDETSGLPRKYFHLKKARKNLLESTEQIIQEMKTAKKMTSNFRLKLEEILN